MNNLIDNIEALIDFIEENHITDESADDGDGHIAEWRSGEFQILIDNTKESIKRAKEV